MDIKIFYENNTDLAEYEALSKGYRKDVIVEIGNRKYKVYIITMIRLQQDYDEEKRTTGYYTSEPNTILVDSMEKREIEEVIYKMYQNKYFDKLENNGFD